MEGSRSRHLKAIEQLPKGYGGRLAEILNLREADTHPTELWSMGAVFLAKPDGGWRPIHFME